MPDMMGVNFMLRTFETSDKLYKKSKEICDRKGSKIGN